MEPAKVAAACTLALAVPSRSADLCLACTKLVEPALASCRSCGPILLAAAPSTSDQPSPTLPTTNQRPVSVVVGAGPAGILSAVCLARRGHCVHVYDRRPSSLEADSSDDTKAFVIMMHARGQQALAAAGFDVPALAAPGSGLQVVDSVALGGAASGRLRRGMAFQQPRLAGPRHAFVAAMLRQAQEMHPTAIVWHWETAFEGVDLTAKTARFAPCGSSGSGASSAGAAGSGKGGRRSSCDGGSAGASSAAGVHWEEGKQQQGGSQQGELSGRAHQEQAAKGEGHSWRYDLLVAADGGWSRVRRAAERQHPALTCTLDSSPLSYKVFRGLPPSRDMPLCSTAATSAFSKGEAASAASPASPAAASETAAGDAPPCASPPAAAAAPQMRVLFSGGKGLDRPAAMFVGCDPADGTARGILSMPTEQWESLGLVAAGGEAYEAFLGRHFPELPADWVPLMAAQLSERPLAVAGMRVHASQLHGPGLVLVGDAGHGVTPRTGNGMNAALQDAAVLDQLLGECPDLATLPERFTAARLADARALLWLDGTASARSGTSRWGKAHPSFVAGAASTLARSVLSRALPGWVDPPAQLAMNATCMPYSQVKAQLQRDAALLAAAAAGAATALAVACLRTRR